MRISEVENNQKSLLQLYNLWLTRNNPPQEMRTKVWALAQKEYGGGQEAGLALSSALTTYNRNYDEYQDQRAKQGDPTDLPGAKLGSREREAELLRKRGAPKGNQNAVKPGGQVKTGADGRQLRHDRWHGDGKNAIQQMKQKWKQFQKTSGTFGKDVAKGSFIAKGAEKIGKGIVAMGDRARAAAKGRFN
jgi:hypothetical protein